MFKRLYIYPIISTLIIGILLFLLYGTNLWIDGSLLPLAALSILIVLLMSTVGVVISLRSMIIYKQFLHGIVCILINIVIPTAYYLWFLNNISGM